MLTEERHRVIRSRLAAEGQVLASALAAEFGVSEDTVRRDLRELARAGACRRVYGGALPTAPEPGSAHVRAAVAAPAKAALARGAVRLLASGQTVLIDAGTTNIAVAAAIPEDLSLTVATNCLGVAAALARHANVRLIVLGGTYDASKDACLGGDTIDAIRRLRADLCFLGACGIDPEAGATAFDPAEADAKRAMAAASRALVVVATSDKLATAAPFTVAPPEAIAHLVVGSDAPDLPVAAFASLGTAIHRSA